MRTAKLFCILWLPRDRYGGDFAPKVAGSTTNLVLVSEPTSVRSQPRDGVPQIIGDGYARCYLAGFGIGPALPLRQIDRQHDLLPLPIHHNA